MSLTVLVITYKYIYGCIVHLYNIYGYISILKLIKCGIYTDDKSLMYLKVMLKNNRLMIFKILHLYTGI